MVKFILFYGKIKDPNVAKYQFVINKLESTGLTNFNDSKAFVESQVIWMIFIKKTEEYNSNKKRKILIVFDDLNVDMASNKKLNQIVT